jgi:HK97 family phage prohead protease
MKVMSRPIELRATPGVVQLRRGDSGRGGARIGGYAAVFNKRSRDLGGFVEVIAPGAFNRSRGNGWPNVLCRYEHTDLIGTSAAGTLTLSIDSRGLLYEVEPPRARADVVELVERGDVRYSSFAFRTAQDSWGTTPSGYPLRTPVVDPAYPDATAGLRSLAEATGTPLEDVQTLAGANRLRELLPSVPQRISGRDALARLNALDKPRTSGAAALAVIRTREHEVLR